MSIGDHGVDDGKVENLVGEGHAAFVRVAVGLS
jgi:hypothetical protein